MINSQSENSKKQIFLSLYQVSKVKRGKSESEKMRYVEQIMVSYSSEEAAALWWCLPSHNQRTPQVIKRVPWQKKICSERSEFTTRENPWSNSIQIGLWFNCYDNTTVLHSFKYNAWELTPWSTRVGNNIKSFCFSKPPPPPQSDVSFVTAYCRSLPLIAQSVHYNAFDTQLKKVSARKHRSHIFLVYSYAIWNSRINI